MKISDLTVIYDDIKALDNINLEIPDNKITSILGPSGSGKTTLLKSICGLTEYTGNIDMYDRFSYIFQEDRLVDFITVLDNLKIVNNDIEKIDNILAILNISHLKDKYPKYLSGGERKRVNIARAFIYDGDIVLSDEALASLDEANRYKILNHIVELWNSNKKTMIMVTHSIEEALYLSDKIIIMNKGKIDLEYSLDSNKCRDISDTMKYYKEILEYFKHL
ncbi:MAG: ABC transporter ATP-binding protein [Anaeroplasmataceae bacterium]